MYASGAGEPGMCPNRGSTHPPGGSGLAQEQPNASPPLPKLGGGKEDLPVLGQQRCPTQGGALSSQLLGAPH